MPDTFRRSPGLVAFQPRALRVPDPVRLRARALFDAVDDGILERDGGQARPPRRIGTVQHRERDAVGVMLATSVAGVRGAPTMAGVMTLPLALPNGEPFPARQLAIFLAASVIVVSLLGQIDLLEARYQQD